MTFLEHCGRASGCFRFVKGFQPFRGGGGCCLEFLFEIRGHHAFLIET